MVEMDAGCKCMAVYRLGSRLVQATWESQAAEAEAADFHHGWGKTCFWPGYDRGGIMLLCQAQINMARSRLGRCPTRQPRTMGESKKRKHISPFSVRNTEPGMDNWAKENFF